MTLTTRLRRRTAALAVAAVSAAGLAATADAATMMPSWYTPPGPNLTITAYEPGYVVIKNSGNARANDQFHVTTVTNGSVTGSTLIFPGLDAGQSMKVTSSSIHPNLCGQKVTVDSGNRIAESNESDNSVYGYCVR